MFATHRRRAAGFTMIELLVVVAILAVLAALSTGAYFRIRSGQQAKTTEDTIGKLNSALNRFWTAELQNAADTFSGKMPGFSTAVENVRQIANNDPDRAKSLWMYMWMKNAFPQNFTEATSPTTITSGTFTATIPARNTFAGFAPQPCNIQNPPMNTNDVEAMKLLTDQTARESAMILYRLLTKGSARGESFNEEATGALSRTETIGAVSDKVFIDTYGGPLAFVRFAHDQALDAPPYTKTSPSRDPLDPTGVLSVSTTVWNQKTNVENSLRIAGGFGLTSNGTTRNWLPCIISKTSQPDWLGFPTQPLPPATRSAPVTITANAITDLSNDPGGLMYGYKLRRQGARGDQ